MLSRASHTKPLQLANNACSSLYHSTAAGLAQKANRQNVESLENMGKILTDAARNSDKNPGHKHGPRRHRPQKPNAQKFNAASLPDVRWKFPSIERKQFSLEPHLRDTPFDEVIKSTSSAEGLKPGSFVELRRHEIVRHGVILRNSTVCQTPVVVTLLTTGEVLLVHEADIMFTIPNFIETDLTQRCGIAAEADAFKLAARQSVVKRAREFERAVEEAYNAISWEANALYTRLKPKNSNEWGKVSTLEAAQVMHLTPNPPIITLFAVHKHLMGQGDKFVAQPASHRKSNIFTIRPGSHVACLKNVRKWIHDDHPLLDGFAKKAQALIDKSREITAESAGELPSEPVPAGYTLSISEKEIVKLLQLSLDEFRTTQVSPYEALVPSIIKKIGRYKGEINHWTTMTTLREMGVIEPWEDMTSKNRDFLLARGGAPPVERTEEATTELLQDDPHESVRHDFGQLPVFVVDDAQAHELDDGLSIETDPHDPSVQWVHVHIADPTSILSPTHPIALQARKNCASSYFVYDTWPMLPPSFTRSGLRGSSKDGEGEAQKVLTFSMKMGPEGDILDYKVRPGIVRNVTVMKYDDVDSALGLSGFAPTNPFEIRTKSDEAPDLSYIQPYMEQLRQLFDLTERQVAARQKLPIFSYARTDALVTMSPTPGPLKPAGTFEPMLYRGFPELTYTVYNGTFLNGARSLVSECMKLACRVASRFCFEHNVPMFRRASSPLEFLDPADFEKALAMRNDRGEVDAASLSRLHFRPTVAEYTLEMKGHWAMGISADEGYTRVTSPLRRFQDMVAHWQIKSVLLPRSSSSSSPVSSSNPPFTESEILQIAAEQAKFEGVARRIGRRHQRYWSHYYIHRYMQRGDVSETNSDVHPLRRVPAHCLSPPVKDQRTMHYHTEIYMPSLGLSGDLTSQSKTDHQIGEHYLVNVKSVKMGIFPTIVLEPAT